MDIPQPNQELAKSTENAVGVTAEASPVAEFVSSSPAPIQPPVSDDATMAPVAATLEPLFAETVSEKDVADLTSGEVEPADDNWIGKVRDLIKEDQGRPYQEEADAEKLNEDYMKTRFNIDVDAPIEEK